MYRVSRKIIKTGHGGTLYAFVIASCQDNLRHSEIKTIAETGVFRGVKESRRPRGDKVDRIEIMTASWQARKTNT